MAERPTTMKAWQKHLGSTKPMYVDVPVPKTQPDGILVKIHAAGVCHSDVNLLNTEIRYPGWQEKYTLGHEGCGEIVEVGHQVDSSRFKVGEMVAVLAVPGCGKSTCSECSRGYAQICQTADSYGIGQNGSFAPYIAIPSRAAVPLPKGVTAAAGAVCTDAVLTAYHAVKCTGKIQKNQTIAILGIGGLGFNAMQIARWLGARVLVLDNRSQVLDEAEKFGIPKEDIVPVGTALIDFVKARNIVLDTVLDFVGVPETFTAAQNSVRLAGTIVSIGLLSPTLTIDNFLCVRKHLNILCSYGGTYSDLEECLKLISQGIITPQVQEGKMEDFPEILHDLDQGKIKSRIVLIPPNI